MSQALQRRVEKAGVAHVGESGTHAAGQRRRLFPLDDDFLGRVKAVIRLRQLLSFRFAFAAASGRRSGNVSRRGIARRRGWSGFVCFGNGRR